MTSKTRGSEEETEVHLLCITFGTSQPAHELALDVARAETLAQTSAVVVTRTVDGSVQLTQTTDVGAAHLGWAGPWWSLLVATVYAASIAGRLWGISLGPFWNRLAELGLSTEWMDDVARALPVGGSATMFLIGADQREAVLTHVETDATVALHDIRVPYAVRAEIEKQLARAKPV